jgi:NitT/TauT family transport system substrate-binding protein
VSNEQDRKGALDHRTLLRTSLATVFAAPAGAIGAQAFAPRAIGPAIDLSQFPICKASFDAPPLTGAARKLKLSWNAGALCLAPLPVAIDHGFFQKQNLDVELVNYSVGLLALTVPAALGGVGAGARETARLLTIFGKADPSTALVLALHYIQHLVMAKSTRWPGSSLRKASRA